MTDRNSRVAIIGLGAMGLPIAINMAQAGVVTQGWNRSPEARAKAAAAGVAIVENLSGVDAKFIFTILPDLEQVEEVLAAGLRSALKPHDVLIVMGTVSPGGIKKLGAELAAQQIELLDAPVSGGIEGAAAATLSIMVGGKSEVLQEVMPFFEKIGKTVRLLGPLGSGEMAKACNQIIVAITLAGIAEAITLGRKAGLDTAVLLDLLMGGYANSTLLGAKRERIESKNYERGGSANYQLKDLRIALEAGLENGAALPVTTEVTKLFAALIAAGEGELDHSAIFKEIERRSK
jgi:2-hydroxy-3-oxopropionate reductase